jgi:ABC-type nickel/cobalt efflux system permease component RcnA
MTADIYHDNVQTFLSTDVIKFSDNSETFQMKAFQLYLAITIPFMIATFGVWWGMYVWEQRRRAKIEHERRKNK